MADLDSFRQSREILLKAADCLLAITSDKQSFYERLSSYRRKVQATTFNLAVVGEFKRGKSTLVNAFLGENLLPMAVVPLTSIATVIGCGDRKINVHFHNGKCQSIEQSVLADYVTEEGNPQNQKQVSWVEITLPARLMQDGVCIIDTPGVGSAHKHNTSTTYEYLPEIDAAIFLFSADQPASEVELEFLKDVCTFAPKIFLAQNKIDHLSSDELQQSLTYLKKTVMPFLDSPIYPISAKLALNARLKGERLESGFAKLEQEILAFLAHGKAATLVSSSSNKLHKEINSLKQLLLLEQHVRRKPLAELKLSLASFVASAKKIEQQETDAEYIVKGETTNLLAKIEVALNNFAEQHREAVVGEVDAAFLKNQELDKEALIKTLRECLFAALQKRFDQWREIEDKVVSESFSRITTRFVDQANLLVGQISLASKDCLGIAAQTHFEVEPLTSLSRHRYAVDDPFTLAGESLPLLLPIAMARPIIRKRFAKAAASEMSRNAGRLRADFQERINNTTRAFLLKFKNQVKDSLAEIKLTAERALEQEVQTEEQCQQAEQKLKERLEALQRAENLLATLNSPA